MEIQTSRFGPIQIQETDIIHFSEGVLGFNKLHRFVLLDDPNDEIFAWLQSCDVSNIAFPVLEPELFIPNYQVTLNRHDLQALDLTAQTGIRFYVIITIPDDPTRMTANLKAPIVLNVAKRLGRQCVLQDNNLPIREEIFIKLQQRVFQNPRVPIKSQAEGRTAVQIPTAFSSELPDPSSIGRDVEMAGDVEVKPSSSSKSVRPARSSSKKGEKESIGQV